MQIKQNPKMLQVSPLHQLIQKIKFYVIDNNSFKRVKKKNYDPRRYIFLRQRKASENNSSVYILQRTQQFP